MDALLRERWPHTSCPTAFDLLSLTLARPQEKQEREASLSYKLDRQQKTRRLINIPVRFVVCRSLLKIGIAFEETLWFAYRCSLEGT
jgi:hypothetical protein